jgi:hypothetical protein
MRESGVRGVLIYCSDYRCSHSITANADPWPDHIRLSDFEVAFRLYSLRQARSGHQTRSSLLQAGRHWCAYAGLSSQMTCPHSHRKNRTVKFRRTSKIVSVKRK